MPTTIPNDQDAETAIIGACLLKRESIEPALEILEPDYFYRPVHGAIFAAITNLYAHGEVIDATTVASKMREQGTLDEAVGPLLVHTMGAVPSLSPGAVYQYAKAVERAKLGRDLMRGAQDALGEVTEGTDPFEVSESLMKVLLNLGTKEIVQQALTVKEMMDDEESLSPTVIPNLIKENYRIIVTARSGTGKALAVDTPIRTLNGWTTMGSLQVGSIVFDSNGMPTNVINATEKMIGHDCFRVLFSDGSEIVADGDHLWRVVDHAGRHGGKFNSSVVTTRQMSTSVKIHQKQESNYLIENTFPLHMQPKILPIHPYVLGAWLGDGSTHEARISTADAEIVQNIIECGESCHKIAGKYNWSLSDGTHPGWRDVINQTKLKVRLRSLGVLGNKHIPEIYQNGSIEQRLELLQGLMDTDGYIENREGRGAPACEFTSTNKVLAEGVLELILSLGIKASIKTGMATINGRIIGEKYRITFNTNLPVFRLTRKLFRLRPGISWRPRVRYIRQIEKVPSVTVRCIEVESETHCFLAGRSLIPTHNSTFTKFIGFCAAQGVHPFTRRDITPIRTLVIDAENPIENLLEVMEPLRDTMMSRSPVYDEDRFRVWRKPGGINIRNRRDRTDLQREIAIHQPQLVIAGPAYKLGVTRRPKESWEEAAGEWTGVWDDLRTRYHFALLLEAHTSKGEDMDPQGSAYITQWPETGLAMLKEDKDDPESAVILDNFRPSRLQGLTWPDRLERDSDWLFKAVYS